MKRVLALTYFFPPIGGAGAQRPFRLVQHLREHGFEPVVVTGQGPTADQWAPGDEDLMRQIPADLEVHRIAAPEPPAGGGRGRAERLLGVPQPWSRWWETELTMTGVGLAPQCQLIWAAMQPYGSAPPAAEISARTGVPWVADLADPWALDEMLVFPSALHRTIEMRRMRRRLSSASGIVMSTPEAAARLVSAFPELAVKPITVGPVGWERSDFVGPRRPRDDKAFRIVHTGYLHTALGRRQQRTARLRAILGGGRDDARIVTRSHVYLLQALRRVLQERPEWRGLVELHLAGVQTDADREAVGDDAAVKMLGYLDHDDSVALLRSADLLFLPMHDLPPGVRAGLVPGKTYEYVASGRPILAAVPDGDARDILAASGNAFICRPNDIEAMTAILTERIERFLAGAPDPRPAAEVAARYEYGTLASNLASFFEEVLVRSNASPTYRSSRSRQRAPERG